MSNAVQENHKAHKLREDMEKDLVEKDQQLQEIIRKHNEVTIIKIILSKAFVATCQFSWGRSNLSIL
jgi:hypothetical protein